MNHQMVKKTVGQFQSDLKRFNKYSSFFWHFTGKLWGKKKLRSNCPEQVMFALKQVKMEVLVVWWASEISWAVVFLVDKA